MSLDSLITRNNYVGNNTANVYSYTFKIFTENDVAVYVREILTGVQTLLIKGTDYSVSGVKSKTGGAVTLINASQIWLVAGKLKTEYAIALVRSRELKQKTDIKNQGDFFPEIHEDTFDTLVMNDQFLQDQISRSPKLPNSIDPASFNTELPATLVGSVGKSFITNPTGTGFVPGPTADEIASAQGYALNAQASQAAALVSEENALTSSENADVSAAAALVSEAAALASAAASAVSAVAALVSENNADVSEAAALASQGAAATSETNSQNSAIASAASAAAALVSQGAAATSAGNAATSESNASGSAASAAASAVSAANNAAASSWDDVVYKTFADSPVTIIQSDAGKLFSFDATSGPIVVNLPLISGLNLSGPWAAGFVKEDSGDNAITINRNGSDLIGANPTYELSVIRQGAVLVPDTDSTPDKWQPLPFGTSDFLRSQMFNELGSDPTTPPSGQVKVFAKADGVYKKTSDGNVAKIGSGGGGVTSLITNGNADDAAVSIFTPYADAAGTRPVDGNGGSPTVTTSLSAVSPLNGTKSFLLTKPASNTQGQGWSVSSFTVDPAYRAKSLKINFDYILNSGTFVAGSNGQIPADGDMIVYIYDVTNSQLIEPSNIKVFSNSTTISEKYQSSFQTSATGADYRLIFHCASTSALAYEIKVDNVSVSPAVYVYGNDKVDSILLYQNTGLTSTTAGVDSLVALANISSSTGTYALSGNGTTIQKTAKYKIKLKLDILCNGEAFTLKLDKNGTKTSGRSHTGDNNATGSYSMFEDTFFVDLAPGDVIKFYVLCANARIYQSAEMEIVQITNNNIQVSDSYDGRVITARIAKSGTQSIPASTPTKIIGFTVIDDKIGAFNGGTNGLDIKSAGDYELKGTAFISVSTTLVLSYKVNGGTTVYFSPDGASQRTNGSVLIPNLKANDFLEVFIFSGAASTLNPGDDVTYFSLSKIQGPQAIAASEPLNCRYTNTAGTSIANSGDIVVSFPTRNYDSHGSFVTDTFTALTAGKYSVDATIAFASSLYAAGNQYYLAVYKNGVIHSFGQVNTVQTAITAVFGASVSATVGCIAGDTIVIRAANTRSAGATALSTTVGINHLSIKKVT